MLTQLLPVQEPATGSPLFQRSRCLRMRHRGNGCSRCLEACPRQALNFANDPVIDAAICNSCFQCTAACPTDALAVRGFDFNRYLRQVDAGRSPVIGCAASLADTRTAVPCLGLLSDVHLTALGLLRKNIKIDINPCRKCDRGSVAPVVQKRLAHLRNVLPSETLSGISVQSEPETLPPASRRDFFAALKSTVLRQVATAMQQEGAQSPAAYAEKTLPLKRKLLNETLRSANDQEREKAAKAFFFALAVSEACNLCFTCVAVCPAGALRKKKEVDSRSLQFQSASCSGCGLCIDSCRRKAILLRPAETAAGVFIWHKPPVK